MAGKTGKRHRIKSTSDMSFIGPAIMPAALFAVVPRTPPPTVKTLPHDSHLVSEMLNTSAVGRLLSVPLPAGDDAFSDPDSSLFDYEHMNDAGYSTVDFGTLERRRQMERDRLGTPPPGSPRDRSEQQQQGHQYHILEASEIQQDLGIEEEENDPHAALYAVPHKVTSTKKVYSGPPHVVSEQVHAVDMSPVESGAMKRYKEEDLATTPQSLRRTVPNTARDVRDAMRAVQNLPSDDPEGHTLDFAHPGDIKQQSAELKESIRKLKEDDVTMERQEQVLKKLEVQILELQRLNEAIHAENVALKKMASGDMEGARSSLARKQSQDLKEECDVLKATVHRLNIELSKYQAKYRPVTYGNEINTKYLAPLFLAYDDEIERKDRLIKQCEESLESLHSQTNTVLKENETFQLKANQQAISPADWQQIQEQARLVLEENQILLEQINVQQNKARDMHKAHSQQMAKLSKRVVAVASEKNEAERELCSLKEKFKDIKQKYEDTLLQMEEKTTIQTHVHTVTELKQSLTETKETYTKEVENLNTKLQALHIERKNLAIEVADLTASNQELDAEAKAAHKVMKKAQGKVQLMNKALELSEDKELSAHEHLANLIKLAERNAFERDTYAKVAKDQEHETRKAMNKLIEGNVTVGKLEEKLKLYKMKAAAKLSAVASKLTEQEEQFKSERQEYEREIKHLRLLVKEKELILQTADSEKKAVEKDLELMWQAANSENRMMQETMRKSLRKLRRHKGLQRVCDEVSDNEDHLDVSSDEIDK